MKQVALLDVQDVEGFVKAAIGRSGVRPYGDEYDELLGHGYVILCDLARRYDPAREKNPERASFAGYAHFLLPRKLRDAWHRMHPEHLLTSVRDEDGVVTRRYVYHDKPVSLEEVARSRNEHGEGRWELDDRDLRLPGEFVPVPTRTAG